MLDTFLDPKNDVAFKKIFGTKKNKGILIHFLNDMLLFKEGLPIKEVTFLETVLDPEIAAQKTSIVDVLCEDEKGNSYVVEMQVSKEKGFEKRAQFYASKAYSSQLLVGDKYHELKEVIFLAIADFIMFPEKKKYKSDHILLDRETYEHDLKDFSFTFLELGKFNKGIKELSTMIEKWAYFFKNAKKTSKKELEKVFDKDLVFQQAYQELDRLSWSEEELRSYDQIEKYRGTYQAALEQKMDEGRAKGEAKGRAEGEAKKSREIALNLRKLGVALSAISEASGLSEDEIRSLK